MNLILKSILDINLPKFIANDVILFKAIVNDLFPEIEKSIEIKD
jgi:dynein heavy chain